MKHKLTSIAISTLLMTTIQLASAASPDSPYRTAGNFIFLSGVPGGSIDTPDPQTEVKEALDNLSLAVKATGKSMNDIVKMTIYMVDSSGDYSVLIELTPNYFTAPYPARSPVGVASLPGGKRIEIDAVLYTKAGQTITQK